MYKYNKKQIDLNLSAVLLFYFSSLYTIAS